MSYERCERCGRAIFPCINGGVCGCERFEYWTPSFDGSSEDESKTIYMHEEFVTSDLAEEIAEKICEDSPEMYSHFIKEGMQIWIKKRNRVSGDEVHGYFVRGAERVVFYAELSEADK